MVTLLTRNTSLQPTAALVDSSSELMQEAAAQATHLPVPGIPSSRPPDEDR